MMATQEKGFYRVQLEPSAFPDIPRVGRNILLLIADDLGIDQCPPYLAHYATTAFPIAVDPSKAPIQTPTLQSLANAGVMFLNAWSSPVCSPTRACLYT